MSKAQGWLAIVLLAGILGLMSWHTVKNTATVTKWDYHVDGIADKDLYPAMMAAGSKGWELVFARRAEGSETHEMMYEMIFKRPYR
jgi:hypothetical protein